MRIFNLISMSYTSITFLSSLSLFLGILVAMEYPRLGLIRVDAVYQVLLDVRKIMD